MPTNSETPSLVSCSTEVEPAPLIVKFDKWWFPACEGKLQDHMTRAKARVEGRLTYQRPKYMAANKLCRSHEYAVDIGAHVGLWSWQMVRDFENVIAFEPNPEAIPCWRRNLGGYTGARLIECALGNINGNARIVRRNKDQSGAVSIEPAGSEEGVEVELRTLDTFGLDSIGMLKLDCEGYELFALQGGAQTIDRCLPVIVVEQKPGNGAAARYSIGVKDGVEFLKDTFGYIEKRNMSDDHIMVPPRGLR